MKDISKSINYKGKEYNLVFNLNVMETIQAEYGSIEEWGKITDGREGEPNIKAVIFGFREMLNEGIDIKNEDEGTHEEFLSAKSVGRMITDIGLMESTAIMNENVVNSTRSSEKN